MFFSSQAYVSCWSAAVLMCSAHTPRSEVTGTSLTRSPVTERTDKPHSWEHSSTSHSRFPHIHTSHCQLRRIPMRVPELENVLAKKKITYSIQTHTHTLDTTAARHVTFSVVRGPHVPHFPFAWIPQNLLNSVCGLNHIWMFIVVTTFFF